MNAPAVWDPYAETKDEWIPPFVRSYGANFDPAKIPRRRWLLGCRRSIGELTVDSGPPGVNKSTLMLNDAVAIATGRALFDDEVHVQGEVLFLAGEDARRDVEARLAGILAHYRIPAAELGGRLHAIYLADADPRNYTLAHMVDDVATLNGAMLDWLRDYPNLIAVFIDPIAAWHRLIENSNDALQVLLTGLRGLAAQGDRHVGVDHHVNKVAMCDPEAHVGNLAAVRGANVISASARWMFTLAKLKPETADAHGIAEDERSRYRRLDPLKASYYPDDDEPRILRVESVPIANGENVGVLVEVDVDRAREQGAERRVKATEDQQQRLGAALVTLLADKRPVSALVAAEWLKARRPDVVPDGERGPISAGRLRQRLPTLIGDGVDVTYQGRPARLIARPPQGKGHGWELDFEQAEAIL
jgi:hypothetical protein